MMRQQATAVGRRAFIHRGVLVLTSAGMTSYPTALAEKPATLTIGMVTDLHHADKPPAGSRHYRETLGKFAEASEKFVAEKPDFVVELGDLIDAADTVETDRSSSPSISATFSST